MAQVTIYLDDKTTQRMREASIQEGISQSRWVAKLIEEHLTTDWPESIKELAGAWADIPEAKELRQFGEDVARESF